MLPIALPALAATATTQAEYEAQIVVAKQKVSDAQAALDKAKEDLANFIKIKAESEQNVQDSEKALSDAQLALATLKAQNEAQSTIVSDAENNVATAEADLKAKQQAYDASTQNVNNQVLLVKAYEIALADAEIQASLANNNLFLSKNNLTSANNNYEKAQLEYNAAVQEQQDASDKYANAVAEVEAAGHNVDYQTLAYNNALEVLQDKEQALSISTLNHYLRLSEYNNALAVANSQKVATSNAKDTLDLATANMETALANLNSAQANVSDMEPALALALSEMNLAKTNRDIAQYNYDNNLITVYPQNSTAPVAGLKVEVYSQVYSIPPQRSTTAYRLCKTTTLPLINNNWGVGDIMGCGYEQIMVHYSGYITYPTNATVRFQAMADDGFYMSINGVPVVTDWFDKGCNASSFNSFTFQANVSYPIDAWFYENGGGACSTLYAYDTTYYRYGLFVVPASMFTQTGSSQPTYEKDPALLTILQTAQGIYDQKKITYETINASYQNAIANANANRATYDSSRYTYIQALEGYNNQSDLLTLANQQLNTASINLSLATDELDNAVRNKVLAEEDLNASNITKLNALSDYAVKMNNYIIAKNYLDSATQKTEEKLNNLRVSNSDLSAAQQDESQKSIINAQKQSELASARILLEQQNNVLAVAKAQQDFAFIDLGLSQKALDDIKKILETEKQLLSTLASLLLQKQDEIILATNNLDEATKQLSIDTDNINNANESVSGYEQELQAATDELNAIPLPVIPEPTPTEPPVEPTPKPEPQPSPEPEKPSVTEEAKAQLEERAKVNDTGVLPYTAADVVTELQAEQVLNTLTDPTALVGAIGDQLEAAGAFIGELATNPGAAISAVADAVSQAGLDMSDDQREKAQEIIIPVVIVSNVVSSIIGRIK